jgi:two-component system, cell cycle response regulator
MDELREREESGRRMGVDRRGAARLRSEGGRVLIVDDDAGQAAEDRAELGASIASPSRRILEAAMTAPRGRWT